MTAANTKQIAVTDDMKPITEFLSVGNEQTDLIEQLITKSRQPHILENTPNDAAERFSDAAAFEKWQAKGRHIHWLLGADRDLAGIIWYGPKEFPYEDVELAEQPEYSFAIRLYDGYVGHRLARPFMVLSLRALIETKQERGEHIPGIWLQTDTTNEPALASYTKFGYKEVYRDEKRVTMVLDSAAVQAIAASV